MNNLANLGNILVGGGVGSIVTAVVGALRGKRMDNANYAKIVAEISSGIAGDLRQENRELKKEMAKLERTLDELRGEVADGREDGRALRGRVNLLIGLLNMAIPLLETQGFDTSEMRAATNGAP